MYVVSRRVWVIKSECLLRLGGCYDIFGVFVPRHCLLDWSAPMPDHGQSPRQSQRNQESR
jgi:hypothetical protein